MRIIVETKDNDEPPKVTVDEQDPDVTADMVGFILMKIGMALVGGSILAASEKIKSTKAHPSDIAPNP